MHHQARLLSGFRCQKKMQLGQLSFEVHAIITLLLILELLVQDDLALSFFLGSATPPTCETQPSPCSPIGAQNIKFSYTCWHFRASLAHKFPLELSKASFTGRDGIKPVQGIENFQMQEPSYDSSVLRTKSVILMSY